MTNILRANSDNIEFRKLINQLDQYLSIINGEKDDFFSKYNKVDTINHVIIYDFNGQGIGCGAFKQIEETTVEIKRMFVLPEKRGMGIATEILISLEDWARELGYSKAILETAKSMQDAVSLYEKNDYKRTPNYGQYKNIETSVCFKKYLNL